MKDFLEFLVKAIVKNEDAVVITEETEGNDITLKLEVAQEDMGLIIGKEGKTIKALRNLLRAKAIKEEKRVNLDLVENQPAVL